MPDRAVTGLPTPKQERKAIAALFVLIALSVIGAMAVMVGAALALVGTARLIAGWVWGLMA